MQLPTQRGMDEVNVVKELFLFPFRGCFLLGKNC